MTKESLKYVHHWLLYECDSSVERDIIAHYGIPKPASCMYSQGVWARVQGTCRKISLAWAVGGDLEVVMPEEYGYPIGFSSFC